MSIILKDYVSEFLSQNQFNNYTEIRGQVNTDMAVLITNGIMSVNSSVVSQGVSARVYKNGVYGFSSIPQYDTEGIKKVLKAADENATFLDKKVNLGFGDFNKREASDNRNNLDKMETTKQKYLVDFAKEVDDYIKNKYPKLLSRMVRTTYLGMEKVFKNTDGVFSHSLIPRTLIQVQLVLEGNDGAPVSLYAGFGGGDSIMNILKNPSDYNKDIDDLYTKLEKKAEGVYAEAGLKDVILHSDLSGILAHEAVGHTTEADLVMMGSVAGKLMNQKVASDKVTLVDFAHHALGIECPVPIYVDDEGVVADDVTIIENGILKSYMHNKESAMKLGYEAKGNARAFQFSDEPLIRMRNTCILPGSSKLEEMIESIDDGYFFMNTSNGQADTTAEFMFGVCMGYEIKKGKLGKAIKDTTISGIAFDVLKNTTMISDDLTWLSGGYCGKKQMITVGMGGPALKTKVNVGGR